jgi:hypothetical protein
MKDEALMGPDRERARLRVAVEAVNRELLRLPRRTTSAEGANELFDRWGELVTLLALGPEPLWRRCPACGGVGRRDATLCAYCWTTLASLPPVPAELTAGGEPAAPT